MTLSAEEQAGIELAKHGIKHALWWDETEKVCNALLSLKGSLERLESFCIRCLGQFPTVGSNNPDLEDKMAQLFQVLMSEYGNAQLLKGKLEAAQHMIKLFNLITTLVGFGAIGTGAYFLWRAL